MQDPAISACPGVIGINNTAAFSLPSDRENWEHSPYISGLTSISLLTLINATARDSRAMSQGVEVHTQSYRCFLNNYQLPHITFLASQALEGSYEAYKLLVSCLTILTPPEKQTLQEIWYEVLKEK